MPAVTVDQVFVALADANRRQLLETLASGGSASASVLALQMPISRQAITKHLRVLERAGLVQRVRHGKEVQFSAHAPQLAATGRWLQRLAHRWASA